MDAKTEREQRAFPMYPARLYTAWNGLTGTPGMATFFRKSHKYPGGSC